VLVNQIAADLVGSSVEIRPKLERILAMTYLKSDLRRFLAEGQGLGATHMIVTTHGEANSHRFVLPTEDVRVVREQLQGSRDSAGYFVRVIEVYSLTGKHPIEDQLCEHRACHFD
jgi:hypothetical protein